MTLKMATMALIVAPMMDNGDEVPLNKEQMQLEKLLQIIEKNPFATQAYYAEKIGVSKRTVSRMFASLQEKGRLVQNGTKRKSNWKIIRSKQHGYRQSNTGLERRFDPAKLQLVICDTMKIRNSRKSSAKASEKSLFIKQA